MFVSTIFTLLTAALGTVLMVLVLKGVARRIGLTDRPNSRKSHEGEIPLVGGIAIFVAFAISMVYAEALVSLRYFLLAGGLLVVVGAVDDSVDIPPAVRLVLHVSSALIMCLMGGVIVVSLGEILLPDMEVTLGLLAIPFTVFSVVALINAMNMSDGLDGLSSIQTLIPLASLALIAGVVGDAEHYLPLVAMCGCLLGFLYFNLRTPWREKATVFLGDAGSSFLGFALAWFLIDMSQGQNAVIKPVSVLWFALLLIYSTVEIVARRILRRRSPFKPDREHLHHVFILAGFSVTETVATLGVITIVGVVVGIAGTLLELPENVLFATFILFGLLFLRVIFRTWEVMRFLQRSICRRLGERRDKPGTDWAAPDRRVGGDRRRRHASGGE